MNATANSDQEVLDLVSIWTFELLDNSISIENYYALENTLLQSALARESFLSAMRLHSDLIGMFTDTPDYLKRGLRRAVDLADFVQAEIANAESETVAASGYSLTSSNSTMNRNVELGGMSLPAPRSP